MGTCFYVKKTGCAGACSHCTKEEWVLLGKVSSGYEFMFYDAGDGPCAGAFERWFDLAQSDVIQNEYGTGVTLTELMFIIFNNSKDRRPTLEVPFRSAGCAFTRSEFS